MASGCGVLNLCSGACPFDPVMACFSMKFIYWIFFIKIYISDDVSIKILTGRRGRPIGLRAKLVFGGLHSAG